MKLGGGVPSTPTSLRAGLPPPTDLVRFGRARPSAERKHRLRSGGKEGSGGLHIAEDMDGGRVARS